VALARALAVEPRVLLLDEPFGALDARVRVELRRWLRRLHDQFHVTSVLVTHDQDEAMDVADRVVVMRSGRIEQVGTPDEVYQHPATPFVCDFMGSVNVFRGRIQGGQVLIGSPGVNGQAAAPLPPARAEPGKAIIESEQEIFVRPHMILVE
jgi:sulfate transport system ATP-binding protein